MRKRSCRYRYKNRKHYQKEKKNNANESKEQKARWIKKLNKPYRLFLYYAFFDTPDYKILGYAFRAKLMDRLANIDMFQCKMLFDTYFSENLINASSIKDMDHLFFKNFGE